MKPARAWCLSNRTRRAVARNRCIIASPSYWADLADTSKQDYVFYWKRDGAIVAMEIAAGGVPMDSALVKSHITDYVNFARICQEAAAGDQAKFVITGQPFMRGSPNPTARRCRRWRWRSFGRSRCSTPLPRR